MASKLMHMGYIRMLEELQHKNLNNHIESMPSNTPSDETSGKKSILSLDSDNLLVIDSDTKQFKIDDSNLLSIRCNDNEKQSFSIENGLLSLK